MSQAAAGLVWGVAGGYTNTSFRLFFHPFHLIQGRLKWQAIRLTRR